MKLATFTAAGSTRIGVVEGEEIIDLSSARGNHWCTCKLATW